MKQYETEGEPITRHVGHHIRTIKESGDQRPVYGLFIAEKVNPELIFYLNAIAWRSSQYYQGKIQIFPLEIDSLLTVLSTSNLSDLNSKSLLKALSSIFSDDLQSLGELDWVDKGFDLLQRNLGNSK